MPHPPFGPEAFTIPGLDRPVFWYGILVTLGTLAGAWIADRQARKRGHNPDHVWNALIPVMILGLLGARLYHVLSTPAGGGTSLKSYLADPKSIINFWDGGLRGLGIFGAVVGGALGLWLYTRFAKLSFAEWADFFAVGIPLGQAIGRWGNYFNQELYGRQTDLPWGMPVDLEYRLPEHVGLPATARFHPTFLYESLWNLMAFFLLSWLSRRYGRSLRRGDLALIYLVLYPLGRFVAEMQRPDAWMWQGMPVAQIVSVALMAASGLLLLWRHGVFGGRTSSAGA